MSIQLIQKYYAEVEKLIRYGGLRKENSLQRAFINLLEDYKEKKPRDSTICEKFNTYKFADYKDQIIDLLMRVCTVSVGTMKIVKEMP